MLQRNAPVMEFDRGNRSELDATGGAAVVRLRPLKVLIVSADHRFRAVTAMLLVRRGCSVLNLGTAERVGDLLAGGHIDVVLVDGSVLLREVAREVARAIPPMAPVGVVLAVERDEQAPPEHVAVAKWSPFEEMFEAILRADRRRTRPRIFDRGTRPGLIAADRLG